jgi:hypothetical protein
MDQVKTDPGARLAEKPGRPLAKPGGAFKQAMQHALAAEAQLAPPGAPREGAPRGSVPRGSVPVASIPVASIPLASIPLAGALRSGPALGPALGPAMSLAQAAAAAERTGPARHQAGALPAGFRALIAQLETGGNARPDQGYGARNPSSGALGRYQMLPLALRDIGWQDAAGAWTEAAAAQGVRSEADFLGTPAAQEAAMAAYLRRAEQQLDRNGSFAHAGMRVPGLDGAAVPVTEAGLVAAAHRSGAGSVARYLAHVTQGVEAPLSAMDRGTFGAVERRLRQFAEMPYQLASRRPPRIG